MRHAGARAIALRHFSFGGSSAPPLDDKNNMRLRRQISIARRSGRSTLEAMSEIERSVARCQKMRLRRQVNIARRSGRSTLQCLDARFTIVCVPYRGFPSKLHHDVPNWVELGALFHVRIALDRQQEQRPLTDPTLAKSILDSANFYQEKQRWHVTLFLLMPDHIHALLSFAGDQPMSQIIGDWKHFQTHKHNITWQEGYFDHRLRDDERGEQLSTKVNYIRQNPVAAGLCAKTEDCHR
jgi:putative transposase